MVSGRSLLFFSVLLLSACDGGIFGTGGPDDLDMGSAASIPPITDSVANESDGGAGTVSGSDTDDTASGSSDGAQAGDSAANTTAGTTGEGSTTGDAGVDGSSGDTGGTDAGTDGGETAGVATPQSPELGSAPFTNNTTTLTTSDVRINLINTTSLPINVVESSAENLPVLFGNDGVAADTVSGTAALQANESSLDIINNSNADTVFSFPQFIASDATFTTLLVRDNGVQVDTVALVSLTTTTDENIARLRVIQADTLGDENASAVFMLVAAGANPGGMDAQFGPLSFVMPQADYTEVSSGDYELIDPLGRVATQPLSFAGGNVYTVVVLDSGTALQVNDTEAASQVIQ